MRNKLLGLLLAVALVVTTITIVNNNTEQTEQKLNKQIQQLEHKTKEQQKLEVENLKKEIETIKQSKAAEKARIAAENAQKAAQASLAQRVVQTAVPTAQAATGDAKAFIYAKESGNNPGAINASSGACGLGQALPCSKMPCSLSDYACQDNFFTGYMLHRYGSWENARAFWLAHRWW